MGVRLTPPSEAGTTLIEVLLAVVILGLAFGALLGGMATSTLASDIHRKQATAETLLRSAAESVKSQTYLPCATSYAVTGVTTPAGYSGPTVVSVQYWNNNNPATFDRSLATCLIPDVLGTGLTGDAGLQQVTIRVSSSDSRATETVSILKRKP